MKLFIKNKVMTIGGSSYVVDESDKTVYKVKGMWFSPTHKKKIYDKDGKPVYVVRNKFWHMFNRSCFVYDENKQKVAIVTSKGWDFKNAYYIQGYKDEIQISGRFFQFPHMELNISKNGKEIGKLTKVFDFLRDNYTLDIQSEEDAPLFVALTIAIDNIIDRKRKEKNWSLKNSIYKHLIEINK